MYFLYVFIYIYTQPEDTKTDTYNHWTKYMTWSKQFYCKSVTKKHDYCMTTYGLLCRQNLRIAFHTSATTGLGVRDRDIFRFIARAGELNHFLRGFYLLAAFTLSLYLKWRIWKPVRKIKLILDFLDCI